MSFLLFDMEFIEKVFKFHLVPFCSFFFSTLSPGWPPEEITKSYKGNLSAKMSGVLYLGKKCLYFNFIPCIFQCSMLTVLTLLFRSKNPVIANFTEAKRNRQDV